MQKNISIFKTSAKQKAAFVWPVKYCKAKTNHRNAWHLVKNVHHKPPLGAPMVSSEGACAAYYNYQTLL